MNKHEARAFALEYRKQLNKLEASKVIVDEIVESNILANAKNVGLYFPVGSEIDCMKLIELYPNINFYFPVTLPQEIKFYLYDGNMKEGNFHIMEPTSDKLILKEDLDAIIIPSVCITRNNQRIGYGKGYYDKYLDGYKGIKIGVIYQALSKIDCECKNYDITFDEVFKG